MLTVKAISLLALFGHQPSQCCVGSGDRGSAGTGMPGAGRAAESPHAAGLVCLCTGDCSGSSSELPRAPAAAPGWWCRGDRALLCPVPAVPSSSLRGKRVLLGTPAVDLPSEEVLVRLAVFPGYLCEEGAAGRDVFKQPHAYGAYLSLSGMAPAGPPLLLLGF